MAEIYISQVLELHNKVTFEDKCVFRVEERIAEQVKRKLYKLVS